MNYNSNKNTLNELKTHYKSPIKRNNTLMNDLQAKDLNNIIIPDDNRSHNNNNKGNYNNPISNKNIQYRTNKTMYESYPRNNLPKTSSAKNFFRKENNTNQRRPSTRNSKQNDFQNKKRNSSMKNNGEGKAEKYFYQLICKNCYNNKIATKNLKKLPPERKDILNKNFNKINPFYFRDKMNDLHKDNINNKIKELEKLQKQALDKLARYQIDNPTNKEKLQKQNEYSINPLNSYTKDDPRLIRTQQAYDKKENFINNNKDLYEIDKPRKAINDYYNKCLYQVPVLEEEYHVDPEYKKEVNNELKKQIEENRNNKKKKKEEELNDEKIANKRMNDYISFLNKKNQEEKKKNLEDFYRKNQALDNYKKEKEEEENKKRKMFEDEFRKKMKEEDDEMREKNRQKKLNDINKYQNWMEEFENEKNNKKKEEEKEKDKWNNYQVEFNNKCKHGLDIYRCAICNRIYPKDQLIKYYPTSTGSSMNSSKRTSFTK